MGQNDGTKSGAVAPMSTRRPLPRLPGPVQLNRPLAERPWRADTPLRAPKIVAGLPADMQEAIAAMLQNPKFFRILNESYPQARKPAQGAQLPWTPQDSWILSACLMEPGLLEADWTRTVAFRVTDGDPSGSRDIRSYIEGIFHKGFPANLAHVSVGGGMSTGGVASSKEWEGSLKYVGKDGYVFLVVAEGFDLPSIDSQNTSYEIMSYKVPGWHVLAGCRLDKLEVEEGYGNFVTAIGTDSLIFNHGFRPPHWVDRADLREKFIDHVKRMREPRNAADDPQGADRAYKDELAAIGRYLGLGLPAEWR